VSTDDNSRTKSEANLVLSGTSRILNGDSPASSGKGNGGGSSDDTSGGAEGKTGNVKGRINGIREGRDRATTIDNRGESVRDRFGDGVIIVGVGGRRSRVRKGTGNNRIDLEENIGSSGSR